MSKVKATGMKHYEMLYIVSNRFTEDEVEPVVAKIQQAITDKGGEITYTENWGKKKLAYQIDGFNHGYYRLVEFNLNGTELAAIERGFRLSADIIRHQVIVRKQRTMEEIEAEKQFSKKMMEERKKELNEAKEAREAKENRDNRDVREPRAPREEAAPKEKAAEKTDKKKVDLKDLDEKLDKILESDNLL